jgi:hypothetical protein
VNISRSRLITAAFVAAVVVWWWWLPPRRLLLDTAWNDGSIPGVLHVHSRTSDGRGTWEDIAAAAARAGLRFVVITDHGDGTRLPETPAYLSGVLCIDGVEISTRGGHYVALDLPQTPYRLGGDARDVVDDVHRFGGFGIAAHPDSPKSELRWSDWTLPIDGVELINPDTSWRVHAFGAGMRPRLGLLEALLAYPFRPRESIASLLTDDGGVRRRWLQLSLERPVAAVAGADAHAQIALSNSDSGDNGYALPIPSYEASLSVLSVHVRAEQPLSGNPVSDAHAVLTALRSGRSYLAVDGWATPAAFEFTASSGGRSVGEGETLSGGGPVRLQVRSNRPAGYRTTVWRDGEPLDGGHDERAFELSVGGEAATYSVEIARTGRREEPAWLTSNVITVGERRTNGPTDEEARLPDPAGGVPIFDGRTLEGWLKESDRSSLAAIDVFPGVTGGRLRFKYGLAGGAMVGQYSATAVSTPSGIEGLAGVRFTGRAEKPMRIAVQVRADIDPATSERWERSVVLDPAADPRMVRFDDMTPVGDTHTPHPPAQYVRAIMFVVDTTHTRPGASGTIFLEDVRLIRD